MQGRSLSGASATVDIRPGAIAHVKFNKGEVVSARVRNVKGSEYVLTVKGARFTASLPPELSLVKGDVVTLKVVSAEQGGLVRLEVVTTAEAASAPATRSLSSLLKGLLGSSLSSAEITSIKSYLDSLPKEACAKIPELSKLSALLRSLEALSGAELKDAVKGSGLFFESGLKSLLGGKEGSLGSLLSSDLKGALLSLKAALEKTATIELLRIYNIKPPELSAAVEKLLTNIEYHQLQTLLTEEFSIFMPLLWKSLAGGALIFNNREADSGGARTSTCTINLDLPNFGKVSVSLRLSEAAVQVSFLAGSEEFLDIVDSRRELLESALKSAGVTLSALRTRVADNLDITTAAPSNSSRVDIKA
ncbi:MAG: flagellar hook-length control protein FliK [Thermodesulfobacteriota bacterium]